jgi:hypothetical protein
MNTLEFLLGRMRPFSVGRTLYLIQRSASVAIRFAPLKLLPMQHFRFAGTRFAYFYRRYNGTWANERSVEIPIVWRYLRQRSGARVLELGNVLSHYFAVQHDIVDKYEPGEQVINVDIVAYQAERPYDLIVSISTLEHVGWDEEPRDRQKALRAIDHLRSLLVPGGEMLLTFPIGYHPELDALAARGTGGEFYLRYLLRLSHHNTWREASWTEVCKARYNDLYPGATAIAVLFARREPA